MVYEVANGVLIYYLPEELDHYAQAKDGTCV